MIAMIGLVIVLGAVVVGFTMAGGQLMALFHASEIVTICGVALGTVLISTPAPVLKAIGAKLAVVFKGNRFTKDLYLDALRMLYELFQIARSASIYSRRRGAGALQDELKRFSMCGLTWEPSPSTKRPPVIDCRS